MNQYIQIFTPKRFGVYVNEWPRKTLTRVRAETQTRVAFNGTVFNAAMRPVQTFKANGVLYSYEGIDYMGFAWDGDGSGGLTLTSDYIGHDNFISALPLLVRDSSYVPLNYPDELGGVRGRTALGLFSDGRIAVYTAADRTGGACTIERLQDIFMELGVESAINLDGGGSVQIESPGINIYSQRIVQNIICLEPVVYRVQFGAFFSKENAASYRAAMIDKGIQAIVKED